ncbi:MAG: PP2C family protein-serine/threonine phosphatase [Anaerolineales bacterium]
MEERLKTIAKTFWPEIETLSGLDYATGLYNVAGFLYTAPLALAGLGWLIAVTDLALIRAEWPILCLLLVLLFVFEQLHFYFFVEITPGSYSDWQASLTSVIIWSAALIFGYTSLWLAVLHGITFYGRRWWKFPSAERRWSSARNFTFNLVEILTSLVALTLYAYWAGNTAPEGVFPLPGLTFASVLPAFLATIVWWLLPALIWVPLLIYLERFRASALTKDSRRAFLKFWAGALGWPILVGPFAVLAAGLYVQNGVGGYLFFISGLVLASWLAHHLSQAVERSQQRSRELENLEQLGRAILNAPPDASALPDVLKENIPNMFPLGSIVIHIERGTLFTAQTLLSHRAQGALVPLEHLQISGSAWEWLRRTPKAQYFLPGKALPWGEEPISDAVVLAPILDVESSEPIGGIMLSQSWHPDTIPSLIPALQSLAAQVASALHRAKVYAQTLDHQRVEQELALAWQIQESFLPDDLPQVPGWQLAATLEPARETSGDFYDIIPLAEGKLGLLIADVADKGTGAALYMAVSRTLIRTYAAEFATHPELVLGAANRRIMTDTRADLFVSVFYGILDATTGALTYCNAGHNPPYFVSTRNDRETLKLTKTGMALGVVEDATWEQRTIHLAAGDLLVLYTDGVTDADNGQSGFFGEERLLEAVLKHCECSAQEIQAALVAEVHKFVGDAPQFDDITLMVIKREK